MTETSTPATPEAPRTMTHRAWLFTCLGLVALVIGLNLLLAWRLDMFGLLRDTHGRQLSNSRHERKAKYLLNFNYVPDNFDALVIGASSSANWRLDGLSKYNFYNESILGGDGTEQRLLVEKGLEKGSDYGHYKVALVGISRGVTDRHDLQDGLDQVNPHEALGSVYAYAILFDRLHDHLLHRPSGFYPDGSWEFPQHKLEPPKTYVPYQPHKIDHKAAEDYRLLIQELIAHGTRVIYVVAPHYGLDLDGSRQILDQYKRDFLAIMPPAPVIDFNDDRYAAQRANPDNMIDEDHLSLDGVPVYSKLVIERMNEILQTPQP
jgi:hypothetical protein